MVKRKIENQARIEHPSARPVNVNLRGNGDMEQAGQKLKGIGIYYKNDQPSGFGILLFNDDARRMLNVFENSYRKFKASSQETQQDYLNRDAEEDLRRASQLNPYAKGVRIQTRRPTEDEALFMTLGPLTVYILEQEGRIVSDEFNGCQFVYEA